MSCCWAHACAADHAGDIFDLSNNPNIGGQPPDFIAPKVCCMRLAVAWPHPAALTCCALQITQMPLAGVAYMHVWLLLMQLHCTWCALS